METIVCFEAFLHEGKFSSSTVLDGMSLNSWVPLDNPSNLGGLGSLSETLIVDYFRISVIHRWVCADFSWSLQGSGSSDAQQRLSPPCDIMLIQNYPPAQMLSLLGKIKELIRPSGTPSTIIRNSVLRRQKILDKIDVFLPYLSSLLITVGFLWMLALPSALLGRGHYVSENALQPAQVSASIQLFVRTLLIWPSP